MEDELEKLFMTELVPQLHNLTSRSGEYIKIFQREIVDVAQETNFYTSEENFSEAGDLFDRVEERALELDPQDRVFKRIRRNWRSIKSFVKEVKATIRTAKDIMKNTRYYMGMFRAARNYMKSYRRRNPVPRSLLQDMGINEEVNITFYTNASQIKVRT